MTLHIAHLAQSLFFEKEASLEKEAANRHFREFLKDKAKEWFPAQVEKVPPEVFNELMDNYAAGLLEVVDPGKNKIVSKNDLIRHVDKDTGKQDTYLEGKLLMILEGFFSQVEKLPREEATAKAKSISHVILSKARKRAPESVPLVDDKGFVKPSIMGHLLSQTLSGNIELDVKSFSNDFASYLAKVPANSSYISDLIKLFDGSTVTENTEVYNDHLMDFGNSEVVKNTLAELLSISWYGPINIPVDLTRLDQTLTRGQANTLIQRINTIDHSILYKDKDRLLGGMDRLPPYPGAREPWNKGHELLMARNPKNAMFEIREGLHRFMAMMVKAHSLNETKFTVSAYVYDKGAISKLKKNFMDMARSFFLSLPSSSKGNSFNPPKSLQSDR